MKKKMLLIGVLFFLFFMTVTGTVYAKDIAFQNDYEAIDKAAKSMFLVEIIGENDEVIGTGSGFIAFDDKVFVTNHHVIEDAIALRVYSDGYEYSHVLSNVIGADENLDIAIIEFPDSQMYESLRLDPEYHLLRGQVVTAIGSPQGVLNTVSSGNISSLVYYDQSLFDIQFTAPISHGSSGGALFNEEGNVIGLIFAKHSEGESMNYAIPIQHVVALYEERIQQETVTLARYNGLDHYVEAPKNVEVTINENGYPEIRWDTVEGADYYRVYCIKEDASTRYIGQCGGFKNEAKGKIVDELPQWGTTCLYYVIVQKGSERSSESEYAEIQIPSKPTPSPSPVKTPKPTAVPTAIPKLPNGIENEYKQGTRGVGILKIKQRLQELGYYKESANLSNVYNDIMQERITFFREDHEIESTGDLDYITLLKLFSDSAKVTYRYNGTPKPKPTATPKPKSEAAVTLIIPDGSYMEWNYLSGNSFKFHLQVKNTSKIKTIEAFELYCYPVDVWGERLIEEDKVYVSTTNKLVAPGKTVYSDWITVPNASDIAEMYVGVHKVKYSDGTIKSTGDRLIAYSCWEID